VVKLLIGSLLALTAANAVAGNMYIYKDKGGQVLLTHVNPTSDFDKFTKKVKVTYARDEDNIHKNKEIESSQKQTISYGTSNSSNSADYANSAYIALR
jgi:hypothetical protein